jgi:imidazole glycerol-phosphate synthase subunit HisH
VKVAVVNYGMGNLGSVRRALDELGVEVFIAAHPADLVDADKVILPGVGSFREGMDRLAAGGWISSLDRLIREERRPLLGICLGMQMLLSHGEEGGGAAGLGFVSGNVMRLDALGCKLRIPHVGWNNVSARSGGGLFAGVPEDSDFYFVHSYAAVLDDPSHVVGYVTYGVEVVAALRAGNVMGTQFHPEKSSRVGRRLLKNFLELVVC